MSDGRELGQDTSFDVVRFGEGAAEAGTARVATEVPLTLVVNGVELATLSCSPSHLPELIHGFLFTQGLIRDAGDVSEVVVDPARWRADVAVARTPDAELLRKRLYTSGCGRGVMFTTVIEIAARRPLESGFRVRAPVIGELMRWLQAGSELHRLTRGVHSAALAPGGVPPDSAIDDVGRHNAVDKVIGRALLHGTDLGSCVLAGSGRVSSEILFKARRAGIPVVASFGAPTHQAVLLARELGVTLAGLARGRRLTAFSHPERIVP